MSTNLKPTSKPGDRGHLQSFCEYGLYNYICLMQDAYNHQNWSSLKEISYNFERDCCLIGEVKISGKLMILRIQLETEPLERMIIGNIISSIFYLSYSLQMFLIEYLENSNSNWNKENIHYIENHIEPYSTENDNWLDKGCNIQ